MNRNYLFLLFIVIVACTSSHENIILSNAWIAEAPPVVPVNAGYLEINNHSAQPVSLISVSSPVFARIEIHKTIVENDTARMQHYEKIDIEPGQQFVLRPGEFHLMLFDAKSPLRAGDMVPLTVEFSDGSVHNIQAQVRDFSGMSYNHVH